MNDTLGTDVVEEIIKKYADMIYRIALHNLKNPSDADDVLQEVALALITKRVPTGSEEHLKHWIIRVTINKCTGIHRAIMRRRMENIDDYADLQAPERQEVMEEINRLPKNYRNIIYLYYYESYTIAEIADILGKSPNTISSGLQRARKKLRTILLEGGEYNA